MMRVLIEIDDRLGMGDRIDLEGWKHLSKEMKKTILDLLKNI